MKGALAILSVLGAVAAQGVTENIAPDAAAPEGCSENFDGLMEVTVAQVAQAAKRSLTHQKRRDCGQDGILVMSLEDGVLKDSKDRTGYIAANYQFQFDAPAQTGAIYTAGYSVCGNGSLALGGSTVFYQCRSGDFWNLYDRSWAEQCEPVSIIAMACGGADPPGYATQIGDGQVMATEFYTTTIVKPISDGQPQVLTTVVPVPMCQIGDGQVQAHTTPCASITAPAPVSQISDGQIQVTPPAVSQISDGQVQVTSAAPVTQISDGQVQVTSPAVVSQISDGQVQVTSGAPVSQTSDGQVQVTSPAESSPSTLLTTAVPATDSAPAQTSAPPATTSGPVQSGAGRVQMGSLAALFVGLVGAVVFL